MMKRMIAVALATSILTIAVVLPAAASFKNCYKLPNGLVICEMIWAERLVLEIPPYEYVLDGLEASTVVESLFDVGEVSPQPWHEAMFDPDPVSWILTDINGEHKLLLDVKNGALVPLPELER